MSSENNYQPNFNDPRVITRVKLALGFAKGVLSETKPHQWSTLYIDKFFGKQSNPLSKFLREQLLITTNSHWSIAEHKCKEYVLNSAAATQLMDQIGKNNGIQMSPYCPGSFSPKRDSQLISEIFNEQYKEELTTKQFEYKDQSGRLWHPLQSVKREHKVNILADAGLEYQYDIECCAPTLLMQYAEQCGMDLYLFAIRGYLKNKDQYREELAEALDISEKSAKILINALFCGAKIGHSSEFATSPLLLNDPVRINKAKTNPFLVGLKEDIKVCWEYIEPFTTKRTTTTKTGKQRKLPMSSKTKWGVYFDQERKVLNSVNHYLKTADNHCFLEHDGWACAKPLNQEDVHEYVKATTGFRIKLQFTQQ